MTDPSVAVRGSRIHRVRRSNWARGRPAISGWAPSWMGGGVSASPPCRASTMSSHHWIAVSRSVKSESSRAARPSSRLGVEQRGHAALRDQFVAQARDQPGGDVADVVHAAAVDQQRVEVVGALGDLAHGGLGAGEEQVAVQFVHPSAVPVAAQHLQLGVGAQLARRAVRHRIAGPDRRARLPGDAQKVQLEFTRQHPARLHPTHTVAVPVQPRRVHRDPHLTGQYREHPAADAALGRQPDVGDPLAGAVVEPTGRHHREHPLRPLRRQALVAGAWVAAVVRQRRRHHRQVAARHVDRALPEVQVDGFVRVAGDDVERAQHVPDRPVAVPGAVLGVVDVGIERQLAPGVARVLLPDQLEPVGYVGARNQRRRGDRAGVDHRIARPTGHRVQADLVERFTGRLDVDLRPHGVAAALGERKAEVNGLDIDWIVNAWSASPTAYTYPSLVAMHRAKPSGSTAASSGM